MKRGNLSVFKPKGLGEKIRQSLKDLSVDVWGLERKAVHSLNQYFVQVAAREGVSLETISIRISRHESILIEMFIREESKCPLTIVELASSMNLPVIDPRDFEKLSEKIKRFLKARSDFYGIDLYLRVTVNPNKIEFHLVDRQEWIESISFQELGNQLSI